MAIDAATVTVEDGTIAWKLKGGQQSGDEIEVALQGTSNCASTGAASSHHASEFWWAMVAAG